MVVAVIAIFSSILLLYSGTLLVLARAFVNYKWSPQESKVQVHVTVIICARNEEAHLQECLSGLLSQDYPRQLMQVIVVNDASSDSTALLADHILEEQGLDYRILSNPSQKGKKRSISAAMRFARHELIVLRDADTFVKSDQWLSTITEAYIQDPGLVIGPVTVKGKGNTLTALQGFESMVLAVVTGGSAALNNPFLCSGANLAFPAALFERVGGFKNHEHLVSGDDIFFLEDVKRLGNVPITFVKEKAAVVYTYAQTRVPSLIRQKSRWASKFRYNPSVLNLWLATLVFAANLAFVLALLSLPFRPEYRTIAFSYILLKACADVILLLVASRLIKGNAAIAQAVPTTFVYPFYAVVVGCLSAVVKPAWKEE